MRMTRITHASLALVGALLLVGACTHKEMQPTGPGSSQLDSSDRDFIEDATKGGLKEVTLGKLAAQRATNEEVRNFGQKMAQDHADIDARLGEIAERKGVPMPEDVGSSIRK